MDPQSSSEVPPDSRDSEADDETLVDIMTLGLAYVFEQLGRAPILAEVEAAVAALRRAIRMDLAVWGLGLAATVWFARGTVRVTSDAVVALRSVRQLTRSSTRRT